MGSEEDARDGNNNNNDNNYYYYIIAIIICSTQNSIVYIDCCTLKSRFIDKTSLPRNPKLSATLTFNSAPPWILNPSASNVNGF